MYFFNGATRNLKRPSSFKMYLLYSAKLEYRPFACTEVLFTPQYNSYVLYLLVYSFVFLLACFLKHQSLPSQDLIIFVNLKSKEMEKT